MERLKSPIRRCAIYTRKSSEEGLEQDFNSLHAQREACEAFIKSQVGEGWRLIRTAYDDGGLSGGTMERPALQRMLADINQGQIDVVVVYKVDRLTRSLDRESQHLRHRPRIDPKAPCCFPSAQSLHVHRSSNRRRFHPLHPSANLCRSPANRLLLRDFYSGATALSGCFTEGFSLWRSPPPRYCLVEVTKTPLFATSWRGLGIFSVDTAIKGEIPRSDSVGLDRCGQIDFLGEFCCSQRKC